MVSEYGDWLQLMALAENTFHLRTEAESSFKAEG
jgi:hypothetical protein